MAYFKIKEMRNVIKGIVATERRVVTETIWEGYRVSRLNFSEKIADNAATGQAALRTTVVARNSSMPISAKIMAEISGKARSLRNIIR